MKEFREEFQELDERLNSMGSIKDIVKNYDSIAKILTYAGDRNLTAVFFRKINNAIATGELSDEDLKILRSNWLVSQMVNLKKLVEITGRDLYTFELGYKINYVSLINDTPTLINFYTNPRIINSLARNINPELNYWFSRGLHSLPSRVQLAIAKALINKNEKAKAVTIIDNISKRVEAENTILEEEKFRRGL